MRVAFFASATKSQADFHARQIARRPTERPTGARVRWQQSFAQPVQILRREGWHVPRAIRFGLTEAPWLRPGPDGRARAAPSIGGWRMMGAEQVDTPATERRQKVHWH